MLTTSHHIHIGKNYLEINLPDENNKARKVTGRLISHSWCASLKCIHSWSPMMTMSLVNLRGWRSTMRENIEIWIAESSHEKGTKPTGWRQSGKCICVHARRPFYVLYSQCWHRLPTLALSPNKHFTLPAALWCEAHLLFHPLDKEIEAHPTQGHLLKIVQPQSLNTQHRTMTHSSPMASEPF